MQEATIAAIATAPGAGGIAVVRLSGAESYQVAARVFCPANAAKKVEQAKGYTALFGHFVDREEAFDEGVALFFRAPHSYTGEDVVELSCHGGNAVARRLVEACLAAGAQPAAPGEYTRRAFLNGKLGLTQAEAVMDLISADGRQGAALANAALGGALAKKIDAQKQELTAIQAHLAAWVDFPEEDVPELDDDHLHRVLSGVKAELDGLIRNYQADTILREGVDCAIVGRPNAGKSTLLNMIAGVYPLDSGVIELDGTDISRLSESQRAKYLGRVFQDPMRGTAADMQIAENLALAKRRGQRRGLSWGVTKAEKDEYVELLKRLDLGLDTRLNAKVGLLSGGQRQALTLLMATLTRPRLLLLDEHTAALDPKTASKVLNLTEEIVDENHLTTLMVTHNMNDAIRLGNRLIMMHEGHVIYDVAGDEKKSLTVADLLQKFEEVSGGELANDRMLLS